MIQLWSALAVAVLTVIVGPLLRGEVSGRLFRRIRAHVDLREKLAEDGPSLKELDTLIAKELETLREREISRLTRKINGGNLAALIFIALAGGGIVYGLISAAFALPDTGLFWAFWILAAIAALFTFGLAAVGVGSLYAPASPAKPKRQRATS